ncbi:MAG: hypothetical protein EAZ97_10905 [Bacteroidetes bacterium]|nr:MAG: hypothetical protein EAZ97_10905 [Bacteroidota bacterium]
MGYQLKPTDEDWRSKKGDPYQIFHEALDKAFENTGENREDFKITKKDWSLTKEGKTIPVEYKMETGGKAEVNVDYGHTTKDCVDCPHVGWKDGEKGSKRKIGHILLNFVPAGRTNKK